jgi:hypothetical protein
MESMDDLTLQLLINKNHYSKWLQIHSKNNGKSQMYKKINDKKIDISHIFTSLLMELDPDSDSWNESIRQSFEQFALNCIQHIELTEMNKNEPVTPIFIDEDDVAEAEADDERVERNNRVITDFSFFVGKPTVSPTTPSL